MGSTLQTFLQSYKGEENVHGQSLNQIYENCNTKNRGIDNSSQLRNYLISKSLK